MPDVLSGNPPKERRKKEKRNAQEFWSTLSNDGRFIESIAGSTCSSHISVIRVEVSKEKPLLETSIGLGDGEGSSLTPENLSDMLAHIADLEKRGIDILNSREDLMDIIAFSNPSSPPPERYAINSSDSMDYIPPTSEQESKLLFQKVADYKKGLTKGIPIGSPPLIASPPQVYSPMISRLNMVSKGITKDSSTTDMTLLINALTELESAKNAKTRKQ